MSDEQIIRVEGTEKVFRRGRVLAVLLLSLSMSLMAVSSVNVALHTIEMGLGASASDLQWILSGYALAFGVSLIPAGRAGDVMGRGTWFMIGLLVFMLASLACGLAPTPEVLNLARVIQGVGAGMFSPQVTGMIQQYFSGRARAMAFALFGLIVSMSMAVGPVLAGAVIQAVGPASGWRWAFFTNIPLGLTAFVLAAFWLPFESERGRLHRRERPGVPDLDPVGSLLLAGAVLCVMLPFMIHDVPAVWGLLGAAAVLLGAWVAWERRYERRGGQPLVDLKLLTYPSFRNGSAVAGVLFMGMPGTFVAATLFLQTHLHVSALAAGLVALPNALASAASSMWSGPRVMATGRPMIIAGLAVMTLGTALSAGVVVLIASFGISYWWLAVTLALNGLGMGMVHPANQTLAMQDVPVHHGGTAGGFKQTVERIGTALGNAMVTGLLFMVLAQSGWSNAFLAALAAVGGFTLAALLLAVFDLRQHRALESQPTAA